MAKQKYVSESLRTSESPSPDRIWISFAVKINTGNYSNVDVEAGAARDLEADEEIGDAIPQLLAAVKKAVIAEKQRWVSAPKPAVPRARKQSMADDDDVPF